MCSHRINRVGRKLWVEGKEFQYIYKNGITWKQRNLLKGCGYQFNVMQLLSTLCDFVSILNSQVWIQQKVWWFIFAYYFTSGGGITIGLINGIEIARAQRRWELKIKVWLNLEKSLGSRFTCQMWISQIQVAWAPLRPSAVFPVWLALSWETPKQSETLCTGA